jgi:hypothetical protein
MSFSVWTHKIPLLWQCNEVIHSAPRRPQRSPVCCHLVWDRVKYSIKVSCLLMSSVTSIQNSTVLEVMVSGFRHLSVWWTSTAFREKSCLFFRGFILNTFRMNLLPPSSGSKLKIYAAFSSKTSVPAHNSTQCHNPELTTILTITTARKAEL